jgi:integrase
MDVYSRKVGKSRSIWYASLHYHQDGALVERRISTRVTDDGHPSSKLAAEAVAREQELALALGGSRPARTSATLKTALAKLIQKQELAQRSEGTLQILTEKSGKLFEAFGVHTQLHKLTEDDLTNYAVHARKTRAASTVYRELLILRQAFTAAGVDKPVFPDLGEMPPSRDRVLELDEQQSLVRCVQPVERKLSVLAYLQLGTRKSELWKIRLVDWDKRYAYVAGTKTKQARRWVPIPVELYEEWLPLRASWVGFAPWSAVDQSLKQACRRARIAPCSVNDLRRTYATHMARSGCSPLLLAAYMGTSVKMLEEVYARLERPGAHDHEAVLRGVPRLGVRTH